MLMADTVTPTCPPWRPGAVVAMVGDSITSNGRWWATVREQVLARAPGQPVEFRNCGISGGSASGACQRYDWDIAPHRPTAACVMFGMNDVNRGLYQEAPSAAQLSERAAALTDVLRHLTALTTRLQQDGVQVVLVTPTPFDQYAPQRPVPNLPGVDDALAIVGGMVRGLGAGRGLPVVDLHTPLRLRVAAGEPLVGDDRVHPGDAGHAAMAELVLAALLPGPSVPVRAPLLAASRALHEAEGRQRTIAMFRSWAQGAGGGHDDAAVLAFIAARAAAEPNPWVRDQMRVCRELLPRQAELAAEVAALRQRLAAVGAALA